MHFNSILEHGEHVLKTPEQRGVHAGYETRLKPTPAGFLDFPVYEIAAIYSPQYFKSLSSTTRMFILDLVAISHLKRGEMDA